VVISGLKSDGTYSAPATRATPLPSISLLTEDLNKDENADVVSINSNGAQSSVTVFLGNGDGTFQAGVNYALPGAAAQHGVLDHFPFLSATAMERFSRRAHSLPPAPS
jgi:hypothetical protein